MNARLARRTWLTLSALVVILLFATVAADAKLHGTKPPSSLATTPAVTCVDPASCASLSVPVRKAAGSRIGVDCAAPLLRAL
jgi:hypothetical protein